MAGNLYQMPSKMPWPTGSDYLINGPHDRCGKVIKCTKRKDDYLLLVRGVPCRRD